MEGDYQYTPLPAGHIRLFQLDVEPDLGAPITGTLHVLPLGDVKHIHGQEFPVPTVFGSAFKSVRSCYIALSYAWGTNRQLRPITCSGRAMLVRRTLYQALVRIRQQLYRAKNLAFGDTEHDKWQVVYPWHRQPWLWVDAMCINQADIAECNQQVQQMYNIYSSAASLLIWLGEAQSDPPVNLDYCGYYALFNGDASHRFISEDNFDAALLRRMWFKRRWVIQEYRSMNASRRHILVGDFLVSDYFVFSALKNRISERGSYGPLTAVASQRPQPLIAELLLHRGAACLSSHDQIYALMHISRDTAWLQVDYHQPVEDLYRSVAEHYIKNEAESAWTICVLFACAIATQDRKISLTADSGSRLPLWVPDWRGTAISPIGIPHKEQPSLPQANIWLLDREEDERAPLWPGSTEHSLSIYDHDYLLYECLILRLDTDAGLSELQTCLMYPRAWGGWHERESYQVHLCNRFTYEYHIIVPGMFYRTRGVAHVPAFVVKKQEFVHDGLSVYALHDFFWLRNDRGSARPWDLDRFKAQLRRTTILLC